MFSLCHPWFTTTNLSYTFPILETSATASCGSTGILSLYMDVSKNSGFSTQIIHLLFVHRVFHDFHHPFWGFSPYFWKHPYEYTIHLYNLLGIFMHQEKDFPYIFPVTSNSSQFQGRDGIVPPPPDETLGQTLVPLATRFVGPPKNWGFVVFFWSVLRSIFSGRGMFSIVFFIKRTYM